MNYHFIHAKHFSLPLFLLFCLLSPLVIVFCGADNEQEFDAALQWLNDKWNDETLFWKMDAKLASCASKYGENGPRRFEIEFSVVRTLCHKQEDVSVGDYESCAVGDNAKEQECAFNLLESEGKLEILDWECIPLTESISVRSHEEDVEEEEQLGCSRANELTKTLLNAFQKGVKAKSKQIWAKFRRFVHRFGQNYTSMLEVNKRFRNYKRNLLLAKKWQKADEGTAVYGETQFMDLGNDEFQKIYLPFQWPLDGRRAKPTINWPGLPLEEEPLPGAWDWREKGAVTSVKNQGACGSCWAFSVTGNIEGQWALRKGRLQALSEQELLDCDRVDMACRGGLPLQAYKEIMRIGGLEPERDYPYDARKESCHLNRTDLAAYINGSLQLPKDEMQMALWLVNNGPISVGVNAFPLQFYRRGISHPFRMLCSPTMLNHGVLIVGFGKEGNKPFWIIKNSWGPHWGEHGYYRLFRGENVCGIHEMATSAVIN